MKLLSKRCSVSVSCPSVSDPEDGSDELVIVGRVPLTPVDEGVTVSDGETVVRISRELLREALEAESN